VNEVEPTIGPLEKAVRAHHPTPAVLLEARALDRELIRADKSWETGLHGIAAFIAHYASVLLHEPRGIAALGQWCLDAVRQAPTVDQQARAASLLVELLAAVAVEVEREGIGRAQPAVAERLAALLRALSAERQLPFYRGMLVPPMLAFGQRLVMMADEGNPPSLWFGVLAELNRLLLTITQRRVAGEPVYDGRWDSGPARDQLVTDVLEAVRSNRIRDDLDWLELLIEKAATDSQSAPEIFMDLSTYEARDERQRTWRQWFEGLASRAERGEIEPDVLRSLCEGLSDWIANVSDRAFLETLADTLWQHAPAVLDRASEGALDVALETVGLAIAVRLEREAGSGSLNPALSILRRLGAELVTRSLGRVAEPGVSALGLGLRMRTGPITGRAHSTDDVVWRLETASLLARRENMVPDAARLLTGLVTGFGLERFRLLPRGDGACAVERSRRLLKSVSGLVGRSWPHELMFLVRAVLRLAPLSPVELAGASCRATLLALAPAQGETSYLVDLKERILARPGSDNLTDVECVLGYWLDGRAERLEALAKPDSLARLSATESRDSQIRKLLAGLVEHSPVADKDGVRWLARMPETFYQPDVLAKILGFPGLTSEALNTLANLLCVYRELMRRYRPLGKPRLDRSSDDELLQRCDVLLAQRRGLVDELFSQAALGATAFDKLERFQHELSVAGELDACLEELSLRCLESADEGQPALAAGLLGRMIDHAGLSGLFGADLSELAEALKTSGASAAVPGQWLDQVATVLAAHRQRLVQAFSPHVPDALRRQQNNPLSEPAPAWAAWFKAHGDLPVEKAGEKLIGVLTDELMAADGGMLLLDDLVRRLPKG
jgi:hypothetical protein